jgi:putative PIN family toxin of toxin-antitoxin system
MCVVYDTSVLVTILSRRDQILILILQRAISSGCIRLITSQFIIDELETVLSSKFGITKQGAKARTRLLSRVAEVVRPPSIERVSRDVNDDMILATALEGKASYITTHDEDLLVLKEYKGIKIVTLAEFNKF